LFSNGHTKSISGYIIICYNNTGDIASRQ
jgi:hypothetical protein